MTDENSTTAEPTTIKTGLDLEVEKLKQEISELKTRYETDFAEARQANKELWAELHPVSPPSQEEAPPEQKDEALQSFDKMLGINRSE